jgi:hypothetical protein
MKQFRWSVPAAHAVWLCSLGLATVPLAAHAVGTPDPAGDFLTTFSGSTSSADLDVLSVSVTYNAATGNFVLSSTQAGPVGSTKTAGGAPAGIYVWGVNRGAGTAGFGASLGLNGVLFDRTIQLRADGTGGIGAVALPAGSVTISGNTISGVVSATLLPSTGFAFSDYTWNLWPRDSKFAGTASFSDFAPDNSNILTTAVPEPASLALMAAGVGALGWRLRQRRAG